MTHNNIITIDNFEEELDNIILSKKISNDTSSKYNIYSNKDGKLMNVLIKVPQIRLIYNYSHQIYNQISQCMVLFQNTLPNVYVSPLARVL